MTGLAAANKFKELGITDFVILDSQSRLGGRIRTLELSPGVNVNVGANWIQGVDPAEPRLHPIYDLAERCGGLDGIFSDFDDLIVYTSTGNNISDSSQLRYDAYSNASEKSIELSNSLQSTGMPDIYVREALTNSGWTPITPEDNFVEWLDFDFCFAEPPDFSSLFGSVDLATYSDFTTPNGEAGDFYITDSRGTPFLTDCLANNISSDPNNDPRIHLDTTVTRIEYSDDCVCASAMENGESTEYCAPYAIVSFSIGAVKQMTFSPALPEDKLNALDLVLMADFLIVYAMYDVDRFWDDVEYIGHVDRNRGYFPIIQPLHRVRGINGLAFTLTGQTARRLVQDSEESIKAEITQVLRAIYNNDSIPEPSNIIFMDWRADPSFLGMFSNYRPGANDATSELVSPEGGMYLAGEGTSLKYNGFIHGASISGIDTAERIAEGISSGYKLVSNSLLVLIIASCGVMLW